MKKGIIILAVALAGQVANARTYYNNIEVADTTNLDSVLSKWDEMLGEVKVTSAKPVVKMETDKVSYDVQLDDDAKSNTVLDMLRKVPMVTVDGQDNISVNGSSSFKIYVDGKPNMMFSNNASMIFKSMPASMVSKIEVVTNPGAKYDAEGTSGILNIVMNKAQKTDANMNGYNGSVRAMGGSRLWGGSALISGQQGKWTYSANATYGQVSPGNLETEMTQENESALGLSKIITNSSTKTNIPTVMGSFSLGYEIDSVSSINASASYNYLNMSIDGTPQVRLNGGMYGSGSGYAGIYKQTSKKHTFSGSLDYQRFFNADHTRSLSTIYMVNVNPTKVDMSTKYTDKGTTIYELLDNSSLNKENTTEHILQADYTTPLAPQHTLNVGVKGTLRHATSDADYYINNVYSEANSIDYQYNNKIAAAYAEYEWKGTALSAKGGLRYEHTWLDADYKNKNMSKFKKNYGSLVPSLSISHPISMRSNIGVNYNMRIVRPGITYLNPYVNESDPTALTYGNDKLDVEKVHNTSLVYNLFSQKFITSLNLSHAYTGNSIEQYSFYDANNRLNTTYGNIVTRNLSTLNVFASWLVHPNTRLILNGALSYTDIKSKELDAHNSGWQGNSMFGVQQTLPWSLKLSSYWIYYSRTLTLQGNNGGMNMLVANLSRSFLNDKLSVGINYITGLSKGGCLNMNSESRGKDFFTSTKIRVPIANVQLSVTYNFGNSKFKAKTHETNVSSDYIENVDGMEKISKINVDMK